VKESPAPGSPPGRGIRQAAAVTNDLDLSWQPEVGDYVQAFRVRNRSQKAWHKVGAMMAIGVVLAAAGFGVGRPGLGSVGVELFVLLPLMVPVITWLSTHSLWRRRPGLATPTRAVVSAAGIATTGPLVDMRGGVVLTAVPGWLPWAAIGLVLESERVFMVQLTGDRGKRFLVLAKRGLADPAQTDRLRDALTGTL
jgi:hypothetical protein